MPVITITSEFSFDIAAVEDDVIKAEFNRRDAVKKWAHDHWKSKLPAEKKLSEYSDDELLDELEGRDLDDPTISIVDRVYGYLAAGDVDAAMDELQREFGLAPPSHARAIADLISGASHAEN